MSNVVDETNAARESDESRSEERVVARSVDPSMPRSIARVRGARFRLH